MQMEAQGKQQDLQLKAQEHQMDMQFKLGEHILKARQADAEHRAGMVQEAQKAWFDKIKSEGLVTEAGIAYLQDPDSKGIVELLERATKPEYFTEKKTAAKETVGENTSDDEVEEPKKKFGFQKK